jgi:hypothetical protein
VKLATGAGYRRSRFAKLSRGRFSDFHLDVSFRDRNEACPYTQAEAVLIGDPTIS